MESLAILDKAGRGSWRGGGSAFLEGTLLTDKS